MLDTGADTEALVRTLLARGADLYARDANGNTPLHLTAWSKSETVMDVLLNGGADVNAKNYSGCTPLHLLTRDHARAQFWAGKSWRWDARRLATNVVTLGADVNARDNGGDAPLHDAILRRTWHVVPVLLEAGADINLANSRGQTPATIVEGLELRADAEHDTALREAVATWWHRRTPRPGQMA